MKDVLLAILTLGMYARDFDRRAFVSKNFPINDLAFMPNNEQSRQARDALIRATTDNAENMYYMRVANRRIAIIAIISIFVTLASVITSSVAISVAHKDSESTTKALVEVIGSLRVDPRVFESEVPKGE